MTVARLVPFLIFAAFAIFTLVANQRRSRPQRDARAWRPRSRSHARQGRGADGPDASGTDLVRPGDVVGVRDAYSGAVIDITKPLVRCAHCRAFYHADSAAVLVHENAGRCASCGRTCFRAVVLAQG